MTGAYIDKNYVYAVARIRGAELRLLDKNAMDELCGMASAEEVFQGLREKGWGTDQDKNADDMLASEREKLWSFIEEIVPDLSVFDVFKASNDYHNLKAAIKESVMEYDYPGIYIDEAKVKPEVMAQAIRERNFDVLPDDMVEVAHNALDTFLRTQDGQLCDCMVDKACLEAILKAGKESGDTFLSDYAELTVASTDIKIAVRSSATGKGKEFLEAALAECDTLDLGALIGASLQGTEQIAAYLLTTDYADAVPSIKKGMAAFENYRDDLITRRTKDQQRESFGLGPVAAYILARENEMKSVRIIVSGKENGFSQEMIQERVRETYV